MQVDIEGAKAIVKQNFPGSTINKHILYKGLYLFQVFRNDPFEEDLDPFYSVDPRNGELKEFSLFTDGDINEIIPRFEQASSYKS